MPVLTLAQAIVHARQHQPEVRRAQALLLARQSEARIPRAAWLPRAGATAQLLFGTANNTSASYLNIREPDLPRIGGVRTGSSTGWAPEPSTLAAVGLQQELFDFGRLAAQAAVLDALADEARQDAALVLLDVELNVEETFHALLAARQVLAAGEEAYRRAQAHFGLADAGVKSGMRPPIDRTRSQADLARAEVRRVRAENGLVSARAALAAAIGAAARQVDAAEPAAGEGPAPALEEALQGALARSPAVLAALAAQRSQKERAKSIGRELLPNVFASATLSGRAGGAPPSAGDVPYGAGWLPSVGNWHAGVVLQWSLFDAVTLARRAAAQARERVAGVQVDLVRQNVLLQVQQAYLELEAAQKAIPALLAALDAARANHAQAEARFRAGLGTLIDLTDAEEILTGAQVELAVGRFAVARARARLGRAIAQGA